MNCKELENHIIEYAEGACTDQQKMQIEQHLSVCSDCKKMVEEISLIYVSRYEEKSVDISPEAFYQDVTRKIRVKEKGDMLMQRISSFAASVIVLVGLAAGVLVGGEIYHSQIAASSAEQDYYSALASEMQLATVESIDIEMYLIEEE